MWCPARGKQPIFYNHYQRGITLKHGESRHCTPVTCTATIPQLKQKLGSWHVRTLLSINFYVFQSNTYTELTQLAPKDFY